MLITRLIRFALLAATLAAAGSASAQVKTWNFGDLTDPGNCTYSGTSAGNTVSCEEQPSGTVNTLAVNGFSATSTSTSYAAATITNQGTGSGFGMTSAGEVTTSPQHAIDNDGGQEMLYLSFTSAQVLSSVTIGWSHSTDADFQVLRWNTAKGAVVGPASKTAAQLLTAGWELVSTVDGAPNITYPNASYGVNAGGLSSSYWLISAYNSAFGGTGFTSGLDYMKILGVTATGVSVASPGSLALAMLALFGLTMVRRRA